MPEKIRVLYVDDESTLLDIGKQFLEKSGSWFLYQGERLGQGRENAKAYLKANLPVADRIEKALREKFLIGASAEPAQPELAQPEAAKPAAKAGKGKGAD